MCGAGLANVGFAADDTCMTLSEKKSTRWTRSGARLFCSFVALAVTSTALAKSEQNPCRENAIVVFDASGSMGVVHRGQVKIETARRAVGSILPEITEQRRTGLVTYAGCSRIELRVRPEYQTADQIAGQLAVTRARGNTPLSHAVRLAHKELAKLGEPGVIVLVTDGLESCSGKPCRLAARLAITDPKIKIHVVGFALTPETAARQMTCLSQASGGVYVHTNTLQELRAALQKLLTCPLYSRKSGSGAKLAALHSRARQQHD